MRAGRVTAASRGLKTWDHGELVPNNKSCIIPVSPTRSRGVADVNFSLKIQKTKRTGGKSATVRCTVPINLYFYEE